MAHISLVTLGVSDVERASAFYVALGWRRSGASVEGVVTFLSGGTVSLGLFGREALAEDAGTAVAAPDGPPSVALAMNLDSPAAVDEVVAQAKGAGAVLNRSPVATEWGGYSGYFSDLDGHLWEVAHNPFFPLSEDGQVTLPE